MRWAVCRSMPKGKGVDLYGTHLHPSHPAEVEAAAFCPLVVAVHVMPRVRSQPEIPTGMLSQNSEKVLRVVCGQGVTSGLHQIVVHEDRAPKCEVNGVQMHGGIAESHCRTRRRVLVEHELSSTPHNLGGVVPR